MRDVWVSRPLQDALLRFCEGVGLPTWGVFRDLYLRPATLVHANAAMHGVGLTMCVVFMLMMMNAHAT